MIGMNSKRKSGESVLAARHDDDDDDDDDIEHISYYTAYKYFPKRIKTFPPEGVLGMTLNYIWWLGSSSGDLVNVEYLFIAIILKWIGSAC